MGEMVGRKESASRADKEKWLSKWLRISQFQGPESEKP